MTTIAEIITTRARMIPSLSPAEESPLLLLIHGMARCHSVQVPTALLPPTVVFTQQRIDRPGRHSPEQTDALIKDRFGRLIPVLPGPLQLNAQLRILHALAECLETHAPLSALRAGIKEMLHERLIPVGKARWRP